MDKTDSKSILRPSDAIREAINLEYYSLPRHEIEERQKALREKAETLRAAEVPFAPYDGKADPKRAAKVTEKFVAGKKDFREEIRSVYHDKANGVAVATDSRVLIVTKYGFDPDANSEGRNYPDYKAVIPVDYLSCKCASVNPVEIVKTCKTAIRLAKATKHRADCIVSLVIGGELYDFSVTAMLPFAEAMSANGIAEIWGNTPNGPVFAKNDDTTLAMMPVRGIAKAWGRGYGRTFRFSGHSGRILTAPDRTDDNCMTCDKYLDCERKTLAEEKAIGGNEKGVKAIERNIEKVERLRSAEDEIEDLIIRKEDA